MLPNWDDAPANVVDHITIHWLTVTVSFHKHEGESTLLRLTDMLNNSGGVWVQKSGARFYGSRLVLVHEGDKKAGITIYYNPLRLTADGLQHLSVDIPGSACEFLYPSQIILLIYSFDSKLTRLDVARDLNASALLPVHFYNAFLRRDLVSRVAGSSIKYLESFSGSTFYMGSRQSGRLLRVYDQRGYTRIEFELRGAWADNIREVLKCEGTFALKLCEFYNGIFLDVCRLRDARNKKENDQITARNVWHVRSLASGSTSYKPIKGKIATTYGKRVEWFSNLVDSISPKINHEDLSPIAKRLENRIKHEQENEDKKNGEFLETLDKDYT